jgi:hypothetical protein
MRQSNVLGVVQEKNVHTQQPLAFAILNWLTTEIDDRVALLHYEAVKGAFTVGLLDCTALNLNRGLHTADEPSFSLFSW